MYKTVFKRRNPLIKALDSCEDDEKRELLEQTTSKSTLFAGMWQTLTDQEKLVIFHKYMTKNTILKFKRRRQTSERNGTPQNVSETPEEGASDSMLHNIDSTQDSISDTII